MCVQLWSNNSFRDKPDNVLHEEVDQNELYDGDQCPSIHKQCIHHWRPPFSGVVWYPWWQWSVKHNSNFKYLNRKVIQKGTSSINIDKEKVFFLFHESCRGSRKKGQKPSLSLTYIRSKIFLLGDNFLLRKNCMAWNLAFVSSRNILDCSLTLYSDLWSRNT